MSLIVVFLVLTLTPLTVWGVNHKFLSGKLKNVSISAISATLVYAFIIVSVAYVEHKLDIELAAFDLNGDGFFSGNEITQNQEKAMYRVTSDTGRTFAPYTGTVFSVFYFLVVWFLLFIISKVDGFHMR
jgi:hypothetical protein